MWGPEAFTGAFVEPYAESPGEERIVQYFDKARMEITNPGADQNSIWYVTNGLLVVELITGNMQVGHHEFNPGSPAQVNVAGDLDDPDGPTYASFADLLDAEPLPVGSAIIQRVNRQGIVSSDSALAAQGVSVGFIDEITNHSIAAPFWAFMNSAGLVYENGQFVQANLFEDPNFATGRPISEPYWAEARVAGTVRLVLVQCFERRVLTYTPGNPEGWLVEAGNVGMHYYSWRYGSLDVPEEHQDSGSDNDHDDNGGMPEPIPGACLMPVSDAKDKQSTLERLAPYIANSEVPSVLGAAVLQMAQRNQLGYAPANELEMETFATMDALPADLKSILACSVATNDALPEQDRYKLFDAAVLGMGTAPLDLDWLAERLDFELQQRTFLNVFGSVQAMTPRPGLARFLVDEDIPEYPVTQVEVSTINGLPASSGNPANTPVTYRPEIHAGDAVHMVGYNFYDVGATVSMYNTTLSMALPPVPTHVFGDVETPLTEIIDGAEVKINDSRAKDQLVFRVPPSALPGLYQFHINVPNSLGLPAGEHFVSGFYFLEVLPSNSTTYQITAEQLVAVKETSPAGAGSDEVGLRTIMIVGDQDLNPGEAVEKKFGIFDNVDSGDTLNLQEVLFQGSGFSSVAFTILGHEVDSKKAYENEITDLAEAIVMILKESWYVITDKIIAGTGKLLASLLGISKSWVAAIAAAIGAGIALVAGLWAPADLIIEDVFAVSLLDLALLASPSIPAPEVAEYESAQDIKVKVVPVQKTAEYLERREYVSDKENSEYHLTLRYKAIA